MGSEPQAFSIARTRYAGLSAPALRKELRDRIGSASEADSIARCMERFGSDESIQFFEVIPQAARRTHYRAPGSTWTVRAVR